MDMSNCRTCNYFVEIHKHPWNLETWSKGSIMDTIGFGCSVRKDTSDNPIIVFFSKDKTLTGCELYNKKGDV